MCWIGIVPRSELRETLLNQVDRGLDSLGIITPGYNYKSIRRNYKGYKRYIKDNIPEKDCLLIMHHRAASVWKVKLENWHPFYWEKFRLLQNWTSKKFYNKYKDKYKKETDSENLLAYIEEHARWIYQIPDLLSELKKDLVENFWIIIIKDNMGNILVWMDWKRESNIEIDEEQNKIIRITNYPRGKDEGFKNVWYIIFDEEWYIKKNAFDKINEDKFVTYSYVATTTAYGYSHVDSYRKPAKSYNCWTYWANWDKELKTRRKYPVDMNDLEAYHYQHAWDFFWANLENLTWLNVDWCIEWYLIFHYWVNTVKEYYEAYKTDLWWFWIKEAAIEVLEIID